MPFSISKMGSSSLRRIRGRGSKANAKASAVKKGSGSSGEENIRTFLATSPLSISRLSRSI